MCEQMLPALAPAFDQDQVLAHRVPADISHVWLQKQGERAQPSTWVLASKLAPFRFDGDG